MEGGVLMSRPWIRRRRPPPPTGPVPLTAGFKRSAEHFEDSDEEYEREASAWADLQERNMKRAVDNERTPIKKGPTGSSVDETPAKDDDGEDPGPSSKISRGGGTIAELNPNNSAKQRSIQRPLGTPSWTINFDHRYTYDIKNLQEKPWAVALPAGNVAYKETDFHIIADCHIGNYVSEDELNILGRMQEVSTCFSIHHAGWEVESVQLYCLNVSDPGAVKYMNSNNQDPFLYHLSDIHDVPFHWTTRGTSESGVPTIPDNSTSSINVDRLARYMSQECDKMGFFIRNSQRDSSADYSSTWIPLDRLQYGDKEWLANYSTTKTTWRAPILSTPTQAPYFSTSTSLVGNQTDCNTGYQWNHGYFPSKYDDRCAPNGAPNQAAVLNYLRYMPVGPVAFQDWSQINPTTNLAAMQGIGNIPFFIKIQDIKNPDNTFVDIHFEVIVRKKLTIEFHSKGFGTGGNAVGATAKIYNYPGHILAQPGVPDHTASSVWATGAFQLYGKGVPVASDYLGAFMANVGTHNRSQMKGTQCPLPFQPPPPPAIKLN